MTGEEGQGRGGGRQLQQAHLAEGDAGSPKAGVDWGLLGRDRERLRGFGGVWVTPQH